MHLDNGDFQCDDSNQQVVRSRPLLGTFVEISARGLPRLKLHEGISKAFDKIDSIHRLMSYHDSASELSLINKLAARCPVQVSDSTYEVLLTAQMISEKSNGAFDVTVGSTLERWGLLKPHLNQIESGGSFRDIKLLPAQKVSFARPLHIDLGGIAKGYAVDCAVKVLREDCGVPSGMVNAGGDLRVFGAEPQNIFIRDARAPGKLNGPILLRDAALASSAPYFSKIDVDGEERSALVNPLTGQAITTSRGVTVKAASCMIADALTKVFLVDFGCGGTVASFFEASVVEI